MKYAETPEYVETVKRRFQYLIGKAEKAVGFIVNYCPTVAIYLYGSMARGELKPDSDVDLLVIKPGSNLDEIYLVRSLKEEGLGWPDRVDVNYISLDDHNDAVFFERINSKGEAVLLYQGGSFSFPQEWEK